MLEIEPSAPVAPGLSDGRAGWPWETEPYRLWSLLDMHRLSTALMLSALSLESTKAKLAAVLPGVQAHEAVARRILSEALTTFVEECQQVPLPWEFIRRAERLQRLADDSLYSLATLIALTHELLSGFIETLTDYLFFVVPQARKDIYLKPAEWFGRAALDRFPIALDVRDACQCFAFAQWTAAVFHAMRVLEHGLRALASDLQTPFELENWKTVIDQIEKKIRELEQRPKSLQKSEDLQFYSQAAIQFRYFKDAWRNHVSHSRSHYDEQEADTVLRHVRQFMAQMAARP